MNLRIILLSVLFIGFTLESGAQPCPPSFERITIEDGLSQSTVRDMVEDAQGYMWFATADGLDRYDGYEITSYRHDERDSTSILSHNIQSLFIASDGRMWIAHKRGISCYDAETERFTNYPFPHTGEIYAPHAIVETDSTHLLVSSAVQMSLFNRRTGTFRVVRTFDDNYVTMLYRDARDGTILVGTDHGLCRTDASCRQFTFFPELTGMWIREVERTGEGYWISTEGQGVLLADDSFHVVRQYRKGPEPEGLPSDIVRCTHLDQQGNLWVGTIMGLAVLLPDRMTVHHYFCNEFDQKSISHNSVLSLCSDSQGGVWIGTYFGGVNYYHHLRNRFRHLRAGIGSSYLNDRTISSIVQSPGGDIWIGTNDGGINILDIVTGRISSLSMVRPGNPDLQSENVKSICFVTPDRALVGLYGGGLALVDRQRGVIRSWNTQNSALQNDYVYAIEPVGDRYWIGTLRGLALFDGERFDGVPGVEIRSEQHNMRISALLCDTRGAVWIGTMNGGLFRYDPSEGGLVSYPYAEADDGLLDEFVNCIVEAHDGTIWVGTNGGLNRLERMPDGMYALSAPVEALRNQVVYGVVEDRTGHLWVSTNRGLACYDPVRGRIRFYSVSDGLQGSQFNQYAFCMAASGEIYFGGIHGITIFDPGRLVTNPFTPTPIIKRLRLFDREVRPGDGHEVLERQISFSDRVVFTARQNVFTLEFVGINYLSCGRNTYAYKLEGFDQEWYHTDRTSVSYSNLSPGRYTFLLRAANNDGVWNDTPRRLEIRVLPVWYRSWWATLIWMTLFGGGCYYLALALRARRRIRQELADSERVARMSEQQLRFFVNVSHELRTPLTMIMLPLTEILDRGISSPWLRQQLDYIGRNARKLMQLVNQFLDYRKAELGVMKLRTCQQEVSETLTEIGLLFDRVAKRRSIEYVLDIRTGSERFIYDPEYLERILSNLLTNAFKYTPEGGRITLSAWGEEGDLVLCVSDTGKGIPTEAQARIFDRFYQQDESIDGAGIGLSFVKKLVELHHGTIRLKSAPGVGSTFTVRLPSSESAYAPDEMAQEGTVSDSALERARSNVDLLVAPPVPHRYDDAVGEERYTLLIVDDNADIRNYLYAEFSIDYRVMLASSGEEALEIVQQQSPDLIISDVMMPGMGGIRFCHAIKQNICTSHIPVILLTAKSGAESEIEGLDSGADDYIVKPFSLQVLQTKVTNTLKMRECIRARYATAERVDPTKMTFSDCDRQFLDGVIGVIERNLDNPDLGVEQISHHLLVSRTTLHMKMKAVTGGSTTDFIRKIRLEHACRLLREGRYSVSEVSAMTGFNTPSYFATTFRKYIGCLPSKYVEEGEKASERGSEQD